MSTFLIRSATSQSNSHSIVLTRLGGPRSRPNPHLKFVEVPGIEPATPWLVVRHANQLTNEAVINLEYTSIISNICKERQIIVTWTYQGGIKISHTCGGRRTVRENYWISVTFGFLREGTKGNSKSGSPKKKKRKNEKRKNEKKEGRSLWHDH